MNRYLFLFTISPVQSFIEQSRKTGDLFFSSMILSDIMQKTTVKLKSVFSNVKFIYPFPGSYNMPNQFLAIIETENSEEVKRSLEKFVPDIIHNLSEEALKHLSPKRDKMFNQSYESQINDFIKSHWIAIPYEDNQFKEKYDEIQKVLRGIKNLNSFSPFDQNPGKKCHLCGERNSLIYNRKSNGDKERSKNPYQLNIDNDGALNVNSMNKVKLDDNEGLCAVCFTKRYYKDEPFPSTAKIALADSLEKMSDKNLFNEYRNFFSNNFDEQLLYEENLTEFYFKKYNLTSCLDKLKEVQNKQVKIRESLKSENLKLTKYYALIKLDGDNMGKWMSGDFLNSQVSPDDLMSFNEKVSEKLSGYAQTIKRYFDESESRGKLVYAGGDDVLAFVNLNHLVPTLKHVREKFPKFHEILLKNGMNPVRDGKVSTASCGVVIAHYKTPLSEALKWVRKMEHEAKNSSFLKDLCAIAVLKHSGEISKSVVEWQYRDDSEDLWTIDIIGDVIEALKSYLSNSSIKNIDQEFHLLMDENGDFGEDEIIKSELSRLILRSNRESVDKKEAERKLSDLSKKLISYYLSSGKLGNLISLLNIIRFVTREVSYAD